jgi:oligopeptide/dipeptide ABC transporter ATP-binding protein
MQLTPTTRAAEPLLEIRDLRIEIGLGAGRISAVDGVNLSVRAGEVVGLVGESGCGKSLTAQAVMGLLTPPAAQRGGQILFRGEDLGALSPVKRARHRGQSVSMVFQEPLSALNPVFNVETQIADVLRRHTRLGTREIRERILELLVHVGIAGPARVAAAYPHELSGGMRQRVLIAMAIACQPALVIADEPTTALDATVQAQIIELLQRLVEEDRIALLLISHDFGIISEICDRVYVMYAGQVVETAAAPDLFARPRHPYTSALLQCVPALKDDDSPLLTIEGTVPVLINPPEACRFADRCAHVRPICTRAQPPMIDFRAGHEARCVRAAELALVGVETMMEPLA